MFALMNVREDADEFDPRKGSCPLESLEIVGTSLSDSDSTVEVVERVFEVDVVVEPLWR